MRIAFSGTHYSGKSTLIQTLALELPEYEVYDEPYWMLTELGRRFSDPPTIEDFEEQLECSLHLIGQSSPDALFDRCPIDFIAYALAIAEENGEKLDVEKWESRIIDGLSLLDCIVFLPLENPDPIPIPRSEDTDLRQVVDEKLRELFIEGAFEIKKIQIMEVSGTVGERVKMIKDYLR